jgi:hypothetical protein
MNESPEIIGSMRSVPMQKPLQHRPSLNYTPVYVGLLLYAVCAVAFPIYANTDRLGTGIFDGMGLIGLLIVVLGLLSEFIRRVRRNRPTQLTAGSSLGTARHKNWSSNISIGLFFMVLGICLLVFPGATSSMNGTGLLLFLIGFIVLFLGLSRRSAYHRAREITAAGLKTGAQEQRRASNSISSGLYCLFLSIYFLLFPRGTGMDAYGKGLFYGMGFLTLFLAIMILGSGVSRYLTRSVSPGK